MATTSASDWKTNKRATELTVPSGNVALVRNPGIQVFLRRGMIPNSLIPIVTKGLQAGKNFKPENVEYTDEMLNDMAMLIDDIVVDVVVEPEVFPIPENDSEREDDKLYVDEVDEEDKLFIYQFAVGGTRDIEQFRSEQAAVVADVSNGNKPARKAKQSSRNRR